MACVGQTAWIGDYVAACTTRCPCLKLWLLLALANDCVPALFSFPNARVLFSSVGRSSSAEVPSMYIHGATHFSMIQFMQLIDMAHFSPSLLRFAGVEVTRAISGVLVNGAPRIDAARPSVHIFQRTQDSC